MSEHLPLPQRGEPLALAHEPNPPADQQLEDLLRACTRSDGTGRVTAPDELSTLRALVRAFVRDRARERSAASVVIELKELMARAGLVVSPSEEARTLSFLVVRWAIESYFAASDAA
jgi:hypothetical protein